jgi:hypothetical protein
VLGEAAQRLGDVVRDGGLLGDDEGFCHRVLGLRIVLHIKG